MFAGSENDVLITADQLKKILPNCNSPVSFAEAINKILPLHGITSKWQVCAFIAQTAHESGEYNRLSENLNYSSVGLLKTFPKYFKTEGDALRYARKPDMIANRVYANRMGNGSEESGDGWRYRGLGAIQCTGKNNHTACAKFLGITLEDSRTYLLTPEGAIASAVWFWKTNGLEKIDNFTTLTKRINGGTNGLADREAKFKKAMAVIV